MVDMGVDLFTDSSDSFDTVHIDVLKELVHPFWSVGESGDEGSQEFNQVRVVVVDTEVQAVEESKWVLFNVM